MELRLNYRFGPSGPGDRTAYDDTNREDDRIYNNPASFSKSIDAGKPCRSPLPEVKLPADVRREARVMSDKIFLSYETLNGILKRHEVTIRKRWFKKTRQQRLKILLNAWPNMPAIHRRDFDAFRRRQRLTVTEEPNIEDVLCGRTSTKRILSRPRRCPYY